MTDANDLKVNKRSIMEKSYQTGIAGPADGAWAAQTRVMSDPEKAELFQIFNAVADGMRVVDKDFNVLRMNRAFYTFSGTSPDEPTTKKCFESFPGPQCHTDGCPLKKILSGEKKIEIEIKKVRRDSTWIPCLLTATPLLDTQGKFIGIIENFKDISNIRQVEHDFSEAKKDLEKLNIALEVVLKKKEEDTSNLKENILCNVEKMILPYIDQLNNSPLSKQQSVYVRLIESGAREIISPFAKNLSTRFLSFSSTELRIAYLIKENKRTKEIAELMNVSESTVIFHRKNIRGKLNIKGKKVNLVAHLQTLE